MKAIIPAAEDGINPEAEVCFTSTSVLTSTSGRRRRPPTLPTSFIWPPATAARKDSSKQGGSAGSWTDAKGESRRPGAVAWLASTRSATPAFLQSQPQPEGSRPFNFIISSDPAASVADAAAGAVIPLSAHDIHTSPSGALPRHVRCDREATARWSIFSRRTSHEPKKAKISVTGRRMNPLPLRAPATLEDHCQAEERSESPSTAASSEVSGAARDGLRDGKDRHKATSAPRGLAQNRRNSRPRSGSNKVKRGSRENLLSLTADVGRRPRSGSCNKVKRCGSRENFSASVTGFASTPHTILCASESDGDASSIKLLLSAFEGRPPVIFFDYPPAVGKAKEVDPARILFLDELSRRYPEVLFSHPGVVHRYNAVLNTIYNAGLAEVAADTGKWTLLWSGTPKPEALREFQPFQKTNHFPASNHLGRKDLLWRNIRLMQQRFPDGRFDITPQTFLVPSHFKFWVAAREGDPKALWIWKPCNSSCGRGIKLLPRNVSAKVQAKLESKNGVIQRYIERPLLINGYKFDLRLYVVVTSFDPLKVYLFHEGLVRLATERYTLSSKTLRRRTMHLTNYAVNKNSAAYVRNCDSQATSVCGSELRRELQHSPSPDPEEEPDAEDDAATYDGTDEADLTDVFNSEEEAEDPVDETPKAEPATGGEKATGDGRSTSKWSLKDLREHFDAEGIDYDMVMSQIKDTIIKTLIAAETPIVSAWHNGANYRGANRSWRPVGPNQTCFELFGFDVLLDETLRPWLLEVNTCPSLSSSSPLDKRLKTQLVADMLTLVGLSAGREEVGGCRSTCSASRPGTTEQKARFFRSHTVDGLASESIRLRDLGEAEWSTIMDAHDEYLRRGCFERIYPCETVDEYQDLFRTPRYANCVLAKWLHEGGERCFLPGCEDLRPKWLAEQRFTAAC